MEQGLFTVDEAEDTTPRWSPFQAFIFVFFAALGSWGIVSMLIYMLMA